MVVKQLRLMILMLPLFWGALYAQNVKVLSSVNKNVISLAEQLQLTLKISGDKLDRIAAPTAPSVAGLIYRNVLSSSSSSTSIINGRVSSERAQTFTYIYNPGKVGKFVLPGFKLRIGNRDYSTPPITVEVVKSPSSPTPQNNPDPFVNPFAYDYSGSYRGSGDSRIVALPQSQTVYKGEPAIVSYYLYTNQWVGSYNLESEKDYEGYGKSVYEQPTTLNYEDINQGGERYKRALIKRIALYPQSTGRLQVPTLTGTLRLLDYGYLNKSVQSSAAYLDVKPLPAGAPASFTGAVGSFRVSQSLSSTQTNLGAAITCTVKITGKGNFSQFTAPAYPKQAKFQISSPMVQDQLSTGIAGSRTIYYTILPQETGELTLALIQFSWFDTVTQSWQSYKGAHQKLKVTPANVLSYFSGILQADKPKTLNPLLVRASYPRFRLYTEQIWYWLVAALLLASLIFSGFLAYERKLRLKDPAAYAQKTASRILDKYLKRASEAAGNMSAEFYPLAEKGLLDYLSQNYHVSRGLHSSELISELAGRAVPEFLLQQLEEFLALCQKARFMPGGAEASVLADSLGSLKALVQGFSRLNNRSDTSRYLQRVIGSISSSANGQAGRRP